jgi:hypothetical protein
MFCQAQDRRETDIGEPVLDKCQFLVSHMEQYYSLALLLTASVEDAESCFVLALDRWSKACTNLGLIVQEAANASIKRALVDCALQTCHPFFNNFPQEAALEIARETLTSNQSPWLAAIMQLDNFERFVFVLSVLESYSDQECADLLRCQPREVAESRVQALSSVSAALNSCQVWDA